MAFLSSLNISASGMTAQRLRLDIASENIVNQNTTRTEEGGPYKRKLVELTSIDSNSFRSQFSRAAQSRSNVGGVRVSRILEDDREFKLVYNPQHPDADEEGYVSLPNVDLLKETADAMSASRAYEANVTAFNAVKTMASKAMEIGRGR